MGAISSNSWSFQHITYNEWLPIVVGVEYMDELDILPVVEGYSSRYDPSTNPSILNSFATAAFRFGHTLIQGMFEWVFFEIQKTDLIIIIVVCQSCWWGSGREKIVDDGAT